ncbi:MAG: L,D-transpeptidase family protein, partial [Thermoanaerobaculia bacterium]
PPTPPRPASVAEVRERLGAAVDARFAPVFARARVPYPPERVWLLAFKQERKLELWAAGGAPVFIRSYRILAASGRPGPKLREGDLQVPEGIYRVVGLNPASAYHLSLRLDYPNDFDRALARAEGRDNLGGDIFLHGSNVSEGCLAIGDLAIEELFVLADRVGLGNVRVVIAPNDLRRGAPTGVEQPPAWLPDLYATLRTELARFRLD